MACVPLKMTWLLGLLLTQLWSALLRLDLWTLDNDFWEYAGQYLLLRRFSCSYHFSFVLTEELDRWRWGPEGTSIPPDAGASSEHADKSIKASATEETLLAPKSGSSESVQPCTSLPQVPVSAGNAPQLGCSILLLCGWLLLKQWPELHSGSLCPLVPCTGCDRPAALPSPNGIWFNLLSKNWGNG